MFNSNLLHHHKFHKTRDVHVRLETVRMFLNVIRYCGLCRLNKIHVTFSVCAIIFGCILVLTPSFSTRLVRMKFLISARSGVMFIGKWLQLRSCWSHGVSMRYWDVFVLVMLAARDIVQAAPATGVKISFWRGMEGEESEWCLQRIVEYRQDQSQRLDFVGLCIKMEVEEWEGGWRVRGVTCRSVCLPCLLWKALLVPARFPHSCPLMPNSPGITPLLWMQRWCI